MKYKVLTLTQPWATLVAIGAKRIETRRWATSYRGPLLIHAGASLGPVGGAKGLVLQCARKHFLKTLDVVMPEHLRGIYSPASVAERLPRGAIVAVAQLRYCQPMPEDGSTGWRFNGDEWVITEQERAFGDYSSGRWAWLLDQVRPLAVPIPTRGYQRIWNWEGELPYALPV